MSLVSDHEYLISIFSDHEHFISIFSDQKHLISIISDHEHSVCGTPGDNGDYINGGESSRIPL